MSFHRARHRASLLSCFAFLCLVVSVFPSPGQDRIKPKLDKWLPKDGLYGVLGVDPGLGCDAVTDMLYLQLANKRVTGGNRNCTVVRMLNATPVSIRLNLLCNDYDVAVQLRDAYPDKRHHQEIMTIQRIDDQSIAVRAVISRRFQILDAQMAYCSIKHQREASETKPSPWQPRIGFYASPGADLDISCTTSDRTIIDLPGKRISSGSNRCNVYTYDDAYIDDPVIDVVCNNGAGLGPPIRRDIAGRLMFGPPGFEVTRLKRIDDQTVSIQTTQDGMFSQPARAVRYCSDALQQQYAGQKPN